MAQTLRVYGVSSETHNVDKLTVTVHNRAELLEWAEDFRNAGYPAFTIYTDNSRMMGNCYQGVMHWYNVPGFRR